MTRKTYAGPIVNVSFDGDVCRHAAECVRGMPEVFDVSKRPWIDPSQAHTTDSAQTLRRVVGAARQVRSRSSSPGTSKPHRRSAALLASAQTIRPHLRSCPVTQPARTL